MTAKTQSNLAVRLATAAVGGPVILALLYFGPPWGWLVFVSIAAAIGAWELGAMIRTADPITRGAVTLGTLGVILVLWFFTNDARVLATLLFVVPFCAMLLVLCRLGDMSTAGPRLMGATFGPIWVGGGLGAVALLRRDAGADGPSFVVLSLMLAWLSDTGGYFAGRFLGRRKLYEAVSPKKTVEGAIGGLIGGLVGALLAHFFYLRSLPLSHAVALGLVGSALGQAGDLGESVLKRSSGVKDSGGIVPGHGGILDRVDALLVTGIVCYLYVRWIGT